MHINFYLSLSSPPPLMLILSVILKAGLAALSWLPWLGAMELVVQGTEKVGGVNAKSVI